MRLRHHRSVHTVYAIHCMPYTVWYFGTNAGMGFDLHAQDHGNIFFCTSKTSISNRAKLDYIPDCANSVIPAVLPLLIKSHVNWPTSQQLCVWCCQVTPPSVMSLLEEVPSILDYVTPKTMAALLSSSSSLRRLVHTSATALTIKKACLPDITALVTGGWSQLKHLDLSRSQMDLTLMSALVQGQWPVLQRLKLVKCCLSCEAVRLLVGGAWSSLECLELGKNDLRLEAYV